MTGVELARLIGGHTCDIYVMCDFTGGLKKLCVAEFRVEMKTGLHENGYIVLHHHRLKKDEDTGDAA